MKNKKMKLFHDYGESQEIHIIRVNVNRKRKNDKNIEKPIRMNLSMIHNILNTRIYAKQDVKTYILENLNINSHNNKCAFLTYGNSGYGRTTMCLALANVLNYNFEHISARSITTILCKNKVIMITDLEHVDSSTQNELLNVTTDNSWIIYCVNLNYLSDNKIKGMMSTFELKEYSNDDKFNIAQKYMIAKYMIQYNLPLNNIHLTDDAITHLIQMSENMKDLNILTETLIKRIHLLCSQKDITLCPSMGNLEYPVRVTIDMLKIIFPKERKISDTCNYFL
jgi:ATP-dependent Lon protease